MNHQHPQTIPEICAALTGRGRPELARRLAYFASEEDLEPGDMPVTLESAQGFWEFLSVVDSDTRLEIGCSAEGWICADWRFEDERGVAIWFLNPQQVRFAATTANGTWIRIDQGNTGDPAAVAEKLVEAGLFTWHQESPVSKNSPPSTTLPGTAGVATSERTGC